ncbi:MAG: Receptor family ligand binding region [Clostridiales bacterium]|jgi:ABC-type branched-subunit amino acid transport system substrate-binding protein|nr:Receptor family ligand binding region [Clostridiales bacterium]
MKKVISIMLVITMMVTMLVGCGKDEKVDNPVTSTTKGGDVVATTTKEEKVSQGVTDTTVKVGNTAATSGALAAVGVPFNAGIEARFKQANDAGGIDGRMIEFVHYDDEFDPVKALAATEKLINDDKVFAINGHFGTPTIGATLDLVKTSEIPVVYFAAGIASLYNEDATTLENGKGLFPVQPIYITEGRLMVARAIEEHQAKKIGVIYTNDDAGKDLLNGIENQVKKLGGSYTVVKEQINPGATDVSSAVLKMKNEEVDVIMAASIQATLPTIIKGLISQGVSKPVFTTYSNADATTIANFADDYAASKEKFPIYSNAWVDLSNKEEVDFFVKGMTDFGKPEYAGNAFAMAGWIAGCFMVEGLERTSGQVLNWENFMEAMESAEFKIPMGGTLNYADGQRLGTQAMSLLKVSEDGLSWENVKPVEDLNVIIDRVK